MTKFRITGELGGNGYGPLNKYANIRVTLPLSGHTSVEVYGPREVSGTVIPATVNWSGCGSRAPEDALAYADGIRYAAELAQKWDAEYVSYAADLAVRQAREAAEEEADDRQWDRDVEKAVESYGYGWAPGDFYPELDSCREAGMSAAVAIEFILNHEDAR